MLQVYNVTSIVDHLYISTNPLCRSWDDVTWEGNKGPRTKINGVLGALCHYYYPGMVVVRGVPQAATRWAHWGLKREVLENGVEGRTLQGVV